MTSSSTKKQTEQSIELGDQYDSHSDDGNDDDDDESDNEIDSNPKNWDWDQVQKWLNKEKLSSMVQVFSYNRSLKKVGISGSELLLITETQLANKNGEYNAYEIFKEIQNEREFGNHKTIKKFFGRLTTLKIKSQSNELDIDTPLSINDLIEIKRRIFLFVDKWENIFWIEWYYETNNKLPSIGDICSELSISIPLANVYLDHYLNIDRLKKKALRELLLDFNVYNDCIVWWFIIITNLKTSPSKPMWEIFSKIAEYTPGSVAIQLLEKYQFDLTRFSAHRLDKVAQSIVIGSMYPVCASLRIAKWFKDRAYYDVARGDIFKKIAQKYIDAAINYLDYLESDHLATILLEVKSDIDCKSALDMALEYELHEFVAHNRVERVSTSIMKVFEFLRPKRRDEAFEISPLSVSLVWEKMFKPYFYFTPFGTYVTTFILYLIYLSIFTFLSVDQLGVYTEWDWGNLEFWFWLFNLGYVVNEVQMVMIQGVKQYYSQKVNYFDTVISIVFVVSLIIRIFGAWTDPGCTQVSGDEIPCWSTSKLNTAFTILWSVAIVTLWLRLINFCVLSHSLGPMVQMLFRMAHDIITFFEIMIILFLAFVMCLTFIMGDVHQGFANPTRSAITLFRAVISDFDFDSFHEENEDVNVILIYWGYALMIIYLVLGSLVLLNLLIAMMAKTFDTIQEDTIAAIVFARFKLAINLDSTAAFMPPPLNLLAMFLLLVFYVIENIIYVLCKCCLSYKYDLAVLIMPPFLKKRKLEMDDQILYDNCHKSWIITTNTGRTHCRMTKYNPKIMRHTVTFYADKECGKPMSVSVSNSVERKKIWLLDLFKLVKEGLLDVTQFQVNVDQYWIHEAKEEWHTNKYWICGYCRGYGVKESNVSLKRLCRKLNVNDVEMKLINKISPKICPNCYRIRNYRLERYRFQLVWEIISWWLFYPFVWWILFILCGLWLLILKIFNGEIWTAIDTKISNKKRNNTDIDICDTHYTDKDVLKNMNEMGNGDELFKSNRPDEIWSVLHTAKGNIDPFLLKERINRHIMRQSIEDELTTFEFFDEYIHCETLHDFWGQYFQHFSKTIFDKIQQLNEDYVPLALLFRYPFDVNLVIDEFQQFDWFSRDGCSTNDLMKALKIKKWLNCADDKEREYIVTTLYKDHVNYEDNDDNNEGKLFSKFMQYLSEVQSLFQNTRKIKNMLRDLNTAIIQRDPSAKIYKDQIYFLFEDIRTDIVGIAFFNAMRTENEKMIQLWTIRNTLQSLYYLKNTVRLSILREHPRIYVNQQKILEKVYDLFAYDIEDIQQPQLKVNVQELEKKNDDNKDNEHDTDDKEEEEKEKQAQNQIETIKHRMKLFHNDITTKQDIQKEISAIFKAIQEKREGNITETTIDIYKRKGLKKVKLIQDDECLRYLFEQLSRYVTFNGDKVKDECNYKVLVEILINDIDDEDNKTPIEFANGYYIDNETIPNLVKNKKHIKKLYDHLLEIFTESGYNDDIMRIRDVLSIIMIYERILSTLTVNLDDNADLFVVGHDSFCVFVDPPVDTNNFALGSDPNKWSNKTKVSSFLFQSVLDEQQNFVTLGQIRHSINRLTNDIHQMKCGELVRIMNHLKNKRDKDNNRCKEQREKWNKNTINPGLQFKHLSKDKIDNKDKNGGGICWERFIKGLTVNFKMNINSMSLYEKNKSDDEKEEEKYDKNDNNKEEKKLIKLILKNTQFDVMNDEKEEEEKYDKNDNNKEEKKMSNTSAIKKVFETVLSFNANCITLQQLILFAKGFKVFFEKNIDANDKFKTMMENYKTSIEDDSEKSNILQKKMHEKSINEDDFKTYFSSELIENNKLNAEISWLLIQTNNEFDLCRKIWPFYRDELVNDITKFMESSENIQGIYTLTLAEFNQLKHGLNINDDLCDKLFHVIRFKIRTLSWNQFYSYFKFLLTMKYNVQNSILNSPQAEDTQVSRDGIRKLLNISLNDEANWLFNKCDAFHGSKINWKQIRNYLKKMVAVRDEMRDFFGDKQRDKHFEENKVEIFNKMNDQIIENNKILNDIQINTEKEEDNNKINKSIKKDINYNVNLKKVENWFLNIGLKDEYYELFVDNDFISLEIIKEINDKNDLKYIGVDSKAHQIKIMNHINNLKGIKTISC